MPIRADDLTEKEFLAMVAVAAQALERARENGLHRVLRRDGPRGYMDRIRDEDDLYSAVEPREKIAI